MRNSFSIILLSLCLHQVNSEAWIYFRKWYILLRTDLAQELAREILSLCCFTKEKTIHYFLARVTVLFISSTSLHHTGLNPVFYFNFLYYHADIAFFRPRMYNVLSYKTKDCLITSCPEPLGKSCKQYKFSMHYHSILLGVVRHWNSVIMPFLAPRKTYLCNIFSADNVTFLIGKLEIKV